MRKACISGSFSQGLVDWAKNPGYWVLFLEHGFLNSLKWSWTYLGGFPSRNLCIFPTRILSVSYVDQKKTIQSKLEEKQLLICVS